MRLAPIWSDGGEGFPFSLHLPPALGRSFEAGKSYRIEVAEFTPAPVIDAVAAPVIDAAPGPVSRLTHARERSGT